MSDPDLPTFRLDGRVAIVTGASSGLGARFARVLAGAGASVVLVARRIDRLEALASELSDALVVACDLTDDDAPGRVVDTAIERYGRLDVLVNNAGASAPVPSDALERSEFRRVVEINLTAPFALAQRCADAMRKSAGGGSIVNITSQYGSVGVHAPMGAYAASKGGLENLTRQLGVEWVRSGVRVNAIAPGYFPTEMTEDLFSDKAGTAWLRRTTPMGRTGEPGELDGALLYLASDASSFVTGSVLHVDGGWTAQ